MSKAQMIHALSEECSRQEQLFTNISDKEVTEWKENEGMIVLSKKGQFNVSSREKEIV